MTLDFRWLAKGHDPRKPEQLLETIARLTLILQQRFPAFPGVGTWSSNWWVFGEPGALARHETQPTKPPYEAALKEAAASGAWNPILEKVLGSPAWDSRSKRRTYSTND